MSAGGMLEDLRVCLDLAPRGTLEGEDRSKIERCLERCWDNLDGSNDDGMKGSKLCGRTENLEWNPPFLSFKVERHGARMLGSTRAEVQEWKVDVAQRTARIVKRYIRQLERMDKSLKVEPLAAEIASAILKGRDDSRLEWINSNRDRVRILTTKIIPTTCRETTTGRRKRFIIALSKQLAPHGWRRIMVGTRTDFEKKTTDTNGPMP